MENNKTETIDTTKKNTKLFKKGNTCAANKKGKKSPGSGPRPEWLKEKCSKIIDREMLIEFLGDVASGKDVETKSYFVEDKFIKEKVPADVKDRLKAVEMLLDRGFGKAIQNIESESLKEIARTFLIRPTENKNK